MKQGIRFAFALSLVGCGPGAHTRAGGGVGVLSVRDVAWNPTHALVGRVQAVADAGDVTAVFADTGATILASGAVVAVDHSVTDWVGAGTMPSVDGTGTWLFGVSRDGRIYRLKDRAVFEDISARYGLEGIQIRSASSLGQGSVGFLLPSELAIADGHQIAFLGAPTFEQLIGGGGFGIGLERDALYLFGASKRSAQRYTIPGLRGAALDSLGRVYTSTGRAIYALAPSGELTLQYDSQGEALHGLVAAGNTVWFAEGGELGVLDQARVLETTGLHIAEQARLAPSSTGDVWAITNGALRRLARDASAPATVRWSSTIAPVFARACAACHEPGGVSGVDLSTAAAWGSERSLIRNRVVETGTMPPQGHTLSDADRAIIASWARAAP